MSFFKYTEFDCKCGCKKNNISKVLVEKLDTARRISGVPFIINSGCRCEEHNQEVGGSKTSSHLKGLAVDIKATDSVTRFKIHKALIQAGFERLGVSKDFLHCDIDFEKTLGVEWTY